MPTVNIHEAKTRLSQLVAAAEAGEVVIIARNEEAYIAQCIASVLAATASIQACDIVLVDSHSDDRTQSLSRVALFGHGQGSDARMGV